MAATAHWRGEENPHISRAQRSASSTIALRSLSRLVVGCGGGPFTPRSSSAAAPRNGTDCLSAAIIWDSTTAVLPTDIFYIGQNPLAHKASS